MEKRRKMKTLKDNAMFLEDATRDILESALKELDIRPSKEELEDSEAYVLLHRDNPNTKEVLGSVNLRLPYKIDQKSRDVLEQMNVPAKKTFLTCFGVFDASKEDFDVSIRCNARNEHGFPISYTNEIILKNVEQISDKLTNAIKKEIKEDIDSL